MLTQSTGASVIVVWIIRCCVRQSEVHGLGALTRAKTVKHVSSVKREVKLSIWSKLCCLYLLCGVCAVGLFLLSYQAY